MWAEIGFSEARSLPRTHLLRDSGIKARERAGGATPRDCLNSKANLSVLLNKCFCKSFAVQSYTSPLPFTANHPILGVHIRRVGASATIDQVPEATLTVDNVVAPTAVLLVVVVTTAYLVGTSIAKDHVVAAQGVDAVSELGAYDLLAALGADDVFGQGNPAGRDQHRGHHRKH